MFDACRLTSPAIVFRQALGPHYRGSGHYSNLLIGVLAYQRKVVGNTSSLEQSIWMRSNSAGSCFFRVWHKTRLGAAGFEALGCNFVAASITMNCSRSTPCKSSWRKGLGSYEKDVADGFVLLVPNDWARCGSRNKVGWDLPRWLDRPKQKWETGCLRKSETVH